MLYKRKQEKNVKIFLKRVKDIGELVPGNPYHLRKHISREGNVIIDETHDIVLKAVDGNSLIGELEGESFNSSEFEIFIRH